MALLYMDGFDHYGNGLGIPGLIAGGFLSNSVSNPASTAITALTSGVPVRSGAGVLRLGGNNTGAYRTIGADPTKTATEIVVGFAVYVPLLSGLTNADVLQFWSSGGNAQTTISLTTLGIVRFRRGDGTVLASSPSSTILANQWYYIEARIKYGTGTSGQVELKVDGTTVIASTNTNTAGDTNNPNYQFVNFDSRVSNGTDTPVYLDDLYILDTTGSVNNTFLGPCRVNMIVPDGDTGSQDWTPTPSGDSFDKINSLTSDEDSSYITAALSGNVSDFTLSDLPVTATAVKGIQVLHRARRTDVGPANMKASIKQGSDVLDGRTHLPTTDYSTFFDIFELDPTTGLALTVSDVNSLVLRFTRTS